MEVIINGFDFWNMEAEKYWAPTKNTNLKELVNNAIFSGEYVGSRKVDGQWAMMIKDEEGNLYIRPRSESVNGGYPNKIDWVPHLKEQFNRLPKGTVLLGEIYFDGNEGSRKVTTIMGCLKEKAVQRQEKGDKLSFYIFDILAYDKILTKDWPLESRISEMIALSKWFKNPYIRVVVGALAIIALTYLTGSRDYNGSGMDIIEHAVVGGHAKGWAWALKIVFTAITIGAGFKGGEIVPTFFIGATFGCVVGHLFGLNPGFAAAIGMIAMFCGVLNCPIASIVLSIELFGSKGFILFAIAAGVSYMLSGYYGLYSSQKIMYSKLKAEYINKDTK